MIPMFAGKYGAAWNLGMYSPLYMRVDDGRQVVADAAGSGIDTVRPNETRIITAGTRGSSFPGNYQDLVMGVGIETQHG